MPISGVSVRNGAAPHQFFYGTFRELKAVPHAHIARAFRATGYYKTVEPEDVEVFRAEILRHCREMFRERVKNPDSTSRLAFVQTPLGHVPFRISAQARNRVLVEPWPVVHGVRSASDSFADLKSILQNGFTSQNRGSSNAVLYSHRGRMGAPLASRNSTHKGDSYAVELVSPSNGAGVGPQAVSVKRTPQEGIARVLIRINPDLPPLVAADRRKRYRTELAGWPIKFYSGEVSSARNSRNED